MKTLLARRFAGLRQLTNPQPVARVRLGAIRLLKIQSKCEMKT